MTIYDEKRTNTLNMSILDSLLTAIMRADADALVLHVGERPYVVTRAGNVDLAKTVLTIETMSGMLAQLLPGDQIEALSEVGAVEHQLQPPSAMRDAFTVVAARGGEDIWIEVRRKRALVTPTSEVVRAPEPTRPAEPPVNGESMRDAEAVEPPHVRNHIERHEQAAVAAAQVVPLPQVARVDPPIEAALDPAVGVVTADRAPQPEDAQTQTPASETRPAPAAQDLLPASEEALAVPAAATAPESRVEPPSKRPDVEPVIELPESDDVRPALQAKALDEQGIRSEHANAPSNAPPSSDDPAKTVKVGSGTVVPLTRVVRVEVPPRSVAPKEHSVERLLGMASARGGELVYLISQSRPFLRLEGEMRPVETEPTFSAAEIDAIVLALMPESARESHERGNPAEWTFEYEGLGSIRCSTFHDRRGPGLVFHLATTRPISADQLGLTQDIQALAGEPEGLVIVAGPRGGGKSTLVSALVDLINRQHCVSVITIERQIRIVHDNHLALVSQREARGTGADALASARAALRESPDVLVLEDLGSPEILQLALEAAGTGRLLILSLTAGSTMSAITRVVESFAPAARKAAQVALAERLRGAVSQVVLRKTGGGRIAARELLLSSPAVATLIADGQWTQLASAIANGRKNGMVALNDVLATLVKTGAVDPSEAYRKADNRAALLAMLEHDGVDTSLLRRLA